MSTTLFLTLTAICLGPTPTAASTEMAKGVVFHDKDGDGLRDRGERGVAGVRVSNGVDVVLTDGDGRWSLPVDDETILFVVKPRDWQVVMSDLNMPGFFYSHKPRGSRDEGFIYKGVEPTGPLPDSIDFPLTRAPEPGAFEAILIADPQPYSVEEVNFYARDVLSELVGAEAAFAVSLGDLVGDDLDLFEPLNQSQALVGIPWWSVYGNHDMNFMSKTDEDSDETFERVYGPTTYAFQVGDAHFVALDNVVYQGFDGLRSDGFPKVGNYIGGLRDDQLRFIENYVATVPRDNLIVLMMHIPVDGFDVHHVPQWRQVLELLSGHQHTLSVSGHMHTQTHTYFDSADGYTAGTEHHHYNVGTASGSWWRGARDERGIPHALMTDGTPNGHAIISVDGNRYSIRYKAAGRSAAEQMTIHAPDIVHRGVASHTEIVVNVWNGSPKDRVRMRLGDVEWIEMERVEREDPGYVRTKRREETMGESFKPLPDPRLSAHLWVATLPGLPPRGRHLIEVESRDQFGQTHRSVRPIEIK